MKYIYLHSLSFLCVNSLLKSLCTCLLKGCPPQHIWLVGNGFCFDATNNANCDFDGGDCCDPNANTDWCQYCIWIALVRLIWLEMATAMIKLIMQNAILMGVTAVGPVLIWSNALIVGVWLDPLQIIYVRKLIKGLLHF